MIFFFWSNLRIGCETFFWISLLGTELVTTSTTGSGTDKLGRSQKLDRLEARGVVRTHLHPSQHEPHMTIVKSTYRGADDKQ